MQQQRGSQYGVPPLEMVPQFTSAAAGPRMMGIHGGGDHLQNLQAAEEASPISSRSAPQHQDVASRSSGNFFDELGGGGGGGGPGAGGEGESGGGVGSRWPRQETLTLLKIRSEMDAIFRDATLKGPLWEDVSRKMAELGFKRSAKKCKEKFENVHKYYKRTKEGRAGRQDGKSYRFFSQLEALHSASTTPAAINSLPPPSADAAGASMAVAPVDGVQPLPPTAAAARLSFSSNTSSSSSDSDGEDTDEGGAGAGDGESQDGGRKRKREGWPCGTRKTMAFFEGLIKQLMQRQEAMQQQFLETIEKREQDRTAREEAWKRQEMARLNREYELMAQERAMTASRDAAVISFLQKFAGGVTNPPEELPPAEDQPMRHQVNEIVIHQPTSSAEMAADQATAGGCADVGSLSPSKPSPSSRWPKAEVIALIKLRSGLEARYQDSGPKGPLWEEISAEMKRLGYNRSTKRCKEKWENINKYFKKVKEGNKKRPLDAKTCPYFHELDALYIRKQQQADSNDANAAPPISAAADQASNNGGHRNPAALRGNIGNGHFEGVFRGAPINSASDALLKKPEDIVRELMERQNHEEEDDDDVDHDDYEDDEEEEDGKLRYEIQFQSQGVGGAAAGGPRGGNAAANAPASAAPPSSNAGSFLAMVQ